MRRRRPLRQQQRGAPAAQRAARAALAATQAAIATQAALVATQSSAGAHTAASDADAARSETAAADTDTARTQTAAAYTDAAGAATTWAAVVATRVAAAPLAAAAARASAAAAVAVGGTGRSSDRSSNGSIVKGSMCSNTGSSSFRAYALKVYRAKAKIIRRDCCKTRELYRATLCTATGCLCGAKKQKNSSVLGLVPLNSIQDAGCHCFELLDEISLVFGAGARVILVVQS